MGVGEKGELRIESKEDRALVAQILYKNGYTVSPLRTKKDGKSYIYLVGYELRSQDIKGDTSDYEG